MDKFRNLTKNIFFRIFLAFLGLTFVAFGIGDFLTNSPNSWIAKVNGNKIAYNQFLIILENDKQKAYRQNPNEEYLQYLNSEQFTVDSLNNLITTKLLDSTKQYYKIYPNKDLILKDILIHDQFLNSEGKFNKIAFINYLKRNNLSENQYIEDLDRIASNQIILSSIYYNSKENDRLTNIIYSNEGEERMVDIITISLNNIPNVKQPNEKELSDFFKINQDKFSLPELRKISYIEFDGKDIVPDINVSDSEILEYYKKSSLYIKPATKDFYHMLFDSMENATKFLNKLDKEYASTTNKEKAFLDLSFKTQNIKKEDILFDNLSKENLLPEIANDVFALQVNNHSKVLKSSLGFHIFYLIKENPESKEKLTDQIKDDIRKNLLIEKKEELLSAKIEEISDYLLTSNSLNEVAKKFNFQVKSLEAFDKNGFTVNKEDISKKLSHLDEFVKNSFILSDKEASELFYTKSNNKYYALFVDSIEESRQRTLNEAKDLAIKLFLENKKKEKLMELSQKIQNEIQDNKKSVNGIISDNKLRSSSARTFLKSDNLNTGDKEFLQNIFEIEEGDATKPYKISNEEVKIGVVKKIISPKFDKKKLEELKAKLSREFKINLLQRYDYYLQRKFPIKINNEALNKVIKREN